ncbi:hypothetical protein FCR19_04465 [Campylobacter jejuni]|nr:hypothetical protein [Campylobacter jejuni]
MNLILENVSDDLAKAIKAMAKIANTKVKLKKEKKLTINGFTPEFEKKILKGLEDIKKNPHKYKAYSSVDDKGLFT